MRWHANNVTIPEKKYELFAAFHSKVESESYEMMAINSHTLEQ